MYNPPKQKEWDSPFLHELFVEQYDLGYNCAKSGGKLDDNPNEPSGHERDTTVKDELYFYWYSGFEDFEI